MGKEAMTVMAGAALALGQPSVAMAPTIGQTGTSGTGDVGATQLGDAVSTLAAAITTALKALPDTASEAEAEATIVFAIDQANQPFAVVSAALNSVDITQLNEAQRAALAVVKASRQRLAKRRIFGTGSIAGGGGILGFGFGPEASVGGGSDYTR